MSITRSASAQTSEKCNRFADRFAAPFCPPTTDNDMLRNAVIDTPADIIDFALPTFGDTLVISILNQLFLVLIIFLVMY